MSSEPDHPAFPPASYVRPEKRSPRWKRPSVLGGIVMLFAGVVVSYGGATIASYGDSLSEVLGFGVLLAGLVMIIAGPIMCAVGAMTR